MIKKASYLMAAIMLGWSVHYLWDFLKTSTYFSLKDLKIGGIRYLSDRTVERILAVDRGTNLLTLNIGQLRQRLLSYPWIRQVNIRRLWPHGLSVRIRERDPIGRLDRPDHLLIAADGYLLPHIRSMEGKDLPIIRGIREPWKEGEKLRRGTRMLKSLYTSHIIREYGIAELDLTHPEHPSVILKNLMRIQLTSVGLEQRLRYLDLIHPYIRKWERGISCIDISFKDLIVLKPLLTAEGVKRNCPIRNP